MDIKNKVASTIKKYDLIKKDDTVILGLSGGPDSVCLFNVLLELTMDLEFKLHGAHINHSFREEEADRDQLYVENLCEDNGVPCWSTKMDVGEMAKEEGLSSEEAGRKARYSFFSEIVENLVYEGTPRESIKIAIAHNMNDQVETVLFRFLRGTGTDGLAGMDYKKTNQYGNEIIRPLLDVEKKDILFYCEEYRLEPCIDYTNSMAIYARNRLRLDLLPELEEKYNSNIYEAINRLSEISRQDRDFIWQSVEKEYERALTRKEDNEIWFNQKALQDLMPSIRHRIILKAFGKLGLEKDITNIHLNFADQLICNGYTPQEINLPQGYVLRVSYENIVCENRKLDILGENYENSEKIVKKDNNNFGRLIVNILDINQYEQRKKVVAFDLSLIEDEYQRTDIKKLITIRNREAGDYIRLANTEGRKKLQDLFVDMKVPKNLRDEIPVIAIGREILFIPDDEGGKYKGRYSGNYKISSTTKKVITVEINKNV